MTKTIDFNNLSRGTVVDNEYQSDGVTIQAWTAGGTGNRAMIFDTARPTGGDNDLATSNLGKALIISEDGDDCDPDDNARGGTFKFTFDAGADVKSLTFLDIEETAQVRFYDASGNLIATQNIAATGNNGQSVANFNVEGAHTMEVQLYGSGAIDNLVFDDAASLDGTVSGTSGDDVITVNYTGDPDGDRIDAGDAVLPGAAADDDLVEAGAGDDIVRAGEGDDVVYGDSGDDSLFGEAGDDTVFGGSGDDLVQGGTGDDVLYGDGGDTDGTTEFALDWDQIGSDGSQTLTVDGQSVKVSVSTPKNSNGHEWTVENGMLKNWDVVRDSTADISFDTEVSNVKFTLLDVDRLDEITIMAKDADGNLVEVDFEVTGVHSVNGNTVTGTQTNAPGPAANNSAQDIDVTIQGPIQQLWIVLDDGPERAYSGTVAVSDITFEIPSVDDGVDGNDTIMGGEGDDLIYGNGGDDVITGGTGDDVIYGDNGGNAPVGDAGRESFDWTGISDAQIDSTVTKDTGTVSVTYTRTVDTGKHISALGTETQNVNGIDVGDGVADKNAALFSEAQGKGNKGAFEWEFSEEVENVSFNINDIDGDGVVKVTAYDADGNKITVNLDGGKDLTLKDTDSVAGADTADSKGGYDPASTDDYSVTVSIPGPVAKIVVEHTQDGYNNSGIFVTEIFYDSVGDAAASAGGNDSIDGGEGDDVIYGEGGDDLITGGAGADQIYGGDDADTIKGGAGDTVDGGAGGNDHDVLDLTGQGTFIVTGPDGIGDPVTDSNGNGLDGRIVFVDAKGEPTGEIINFTEIEEIIGDERTNFDPDAIDDALDASEDGVSDLGNVLTNDTDPDGDTLTVGAVNGDETLVGTPVAGSAGGLVTINPDGTISFDANGEFDALAPGETAETTVTYTVDDGNGGTDTATVTVTVNGVNDGPDATDNTYTVTLTETAGDVDGNVITDDTGAGVDSDPEGDTLTVVAVGGTAAGVGTAVAGDNGGTFTINADGTVDFDAGDDFDDLGLGATRDTSVSYTIVDEHGAEDTAEITFTVTGINDGTVQGTAGDDIINPDIPYVDADGDIVDAGDGILPGAEGTDDDLIYGYGGNDSIAAGNGNDVVYGGTGDDTVKGNLGNDVLFGGEGDDNVQGGLGNDILDGGAGDDLLLGNEGDDTIAGGAGDDRVFGGEGDDELRGGSGDDAIEGSEGDDTLYGGTGDDDLWGGLDNDTVFGGDGNDTVAAEDGDDFLYGGEGDDLIYGGAGNDSIGDTAGSDTVYGGDGDDVIDVSNGNTAGALPDVAYPSQPSATIPGLTFPGYGADADPNNDKDFVDGGAGNDIIRTGDDDDSILGGSGNDRIYAGYDDDTVDGGTGDDMIEGAEGNDTLFGGEGDDVIYGGMENPLVDLVLFPDDEVDEFGFQDLVPENNGDLIFGGAGNDSIFGQDDDDTIYGDAGDDYLDGGIDDDLVYGGDGNDTLIGGQGNDVLEGGDGDDTIEGGEGTDTITGGAGVDSLFGGFGSDTFYGGNAGDVVVGGEDDDDSDIDVLDLTGSNVDRIDYVDGDPEAGTVTFTDGSTMTFSEIENVIPCFTPGTLIATPKGERLVEELQVGDRIITRDNGIQEIAWMGHKPMSGQQLVQNPHLQPVLIKRGALGHGLPERDMMVSPNHRVLVSSDKTQLYFEESEVLAAAKHMVGAEGIHTVNVMQTTYIHFMFERHEVVLSNGAWTESFQPGDYSLKGIGNSQRNEIFDLFPELSTKSGLAGYQSARKALKKHETNLLLK